jgi:hypothetical protein
VFGLYSGTVSTPNLGYDMHKFSIYNSGQPARDRALVRRPLYSDLARKRLLSGAIAAILFISTTSILPQNARGSWLSDITGIDVNIPKGTISFSQPHPEDIPKAIQNLPRDVINALNPAGNNLAFLIRQANAQASGSTIQMPADIRQTLTPFFPPQVLDRARFTTRQRAGISIATAALEVDGNINAITVDDIIVFANDNDATNPVLWAHELVHVGQCENMGIDGFAAMYAGWGAQTIANDAYGWEAHVQLALSQNTQLGQQWQDNMGGVIQPMSANDFASRASVNSPSPGPTSVINYGNGDVFEGELSGGWPQGIGKMTYTDGSIYQGQFVRGLPSGWGFLTYANGSTLWGRFLGGVAQGAGIFKTADEVYQGTFANGQKDGRGVIRFSNGDIIWATFHNSATYGLALVRFGNGDVYRGELDNSRPNGRDVFVIAKGGTIEGVFVPSGCQQACGQGTIKYPNGDIYIGEFVNSQPYGRGVLTYSNGTKFEGTFVDGSPSGNNR